jgi:3-hydroxyisobutyrate dehydrogenase-like beta-hydroxyacid dehydrogenase
MSDSSRLGIGLVGYGEVGKILTAALVGRGVAWVGAWDVLFADAAAGPAITAHAAAAGVDAAGSMAALTARADVVVSAVTASQAWSVADEAARTIRPGTWFLDLNSCSPGTKRRSSQRIDAAGGRYVESAVMTSVPPYGIRVPMLLGGRDAEALRSLLVPLGFAMEVEADRIGVASAIKMCRSVMIKGLESLLVESLSSARAYGVEDRVLASLAETFPQLDWETVASYMVSRTALHGKRRAEEMREVAVTVREAGLDPSMASATAERQERMGALKARGAFAAVAKDANWREVADRVIAERRPDAQRGGAASGPTPHGEGIAATRRR